jgi:hypothetical protein
MVEEIAVSGFGHGVWADSDTDESLDEDKDDIVDATPTIEQKLNSVIIIRLKESLFDPLAVFANDSSMFTDLFTPPFIFNISAFVVPGAPSTPQ